MLSSAANLTIRFLVRLACILITYTTASRKLEALNRVSLSACRHIPLLQQSCDDLLHVVEVIRSLDLRILIVVTGRVKPLDTFPIGELQVTVRLRHGVRLLINCLNLVQNLLFLLLDSGVRLIQVHLCAFDILLQLPVFFLKGLDPHIELGDDFILALDQCVDELSLVVLFGLLVADLAYPVVNVLHFFGKLACLSILLVEVVLELLHDDQVVRFDHALEREAELRLEADQVVEDRHKVCVQGRQVAEHRGVMRRVEELFTHVIW